jgi:hypothetical protein
MRASGVRPSSAALVSLMTITAAAPSLSGQALPAVISPSGRNTGLSPASPRGGAGTRAVVVSTRRCRRQRDRGDLVGEEAVLDVGDGALLAEGGELVHLLAGHALFSRTFSAVWPIAMYMSGSPSGGLHGGCRPASAPCARPGGEDRVRGGVAGAGAVAADGLDAGGDEAVALAGLDGVGRHADRLQAGRAVAVDGDAGHVVEAGEDGDDAADVEARPRRRADRMPMIRSSTSAACTSGTLAIRALTIWVDMSSGRMLTSEPLWRRGRSGCGRWRR